ncbi:gamma-glutamyl hydrolase [Salpingoeca rosetta]|uniref:folate gamma-glutamyl hydrolase n=1 Tax=Salpingoeca rosetta (strain ATCC 50818 / BSB-021) TaxID=946362 RepID=F2TXM0_SALR5|nr:gamma-glutamyl hydrolase [Salpingoeca rosetta]EGD76129.1 gamma-glutamyl hydrolase [Salpingoeca rosetta]|eukprot:XP_004998304.1 gamma-glutamyl hydrolase [Salpingoeca rosetta]
MLAKMTRSTATLALVVAVLVAVVCGTHALPANQTGPVIGVLTQTYGPEVLGGKLGGEIDETRTYIAASYVKYLESAGARVVPIDCMASEDELREKAKMINGFLLPGGGQAITDPKNSYSRTARFMMNMAKEFNNKGDYFPVWGTCLGFQMVSVFIGGNSVLGHHFDSEDLPLPLNFTSHISTSKIFKSARPELITALRNQPLTMNNHEGGVTPITFANNANLTSFFNVISTNVDRKGNPFVSTIEGKHMPFYATQWHPEKNSFEWTASEAIPHSALAIETCQLTSTFFVNEARKSNHAYPPEQLRKDIIYNYNPVFTGKDGSGFEQCYFWDV